MLLNFPTTVFLQLFSTWLSVKDFCFLDSSLCCNDFRDVLLETFSRNRLVFATVTEKRAHDVSCLQWLILKGFSVKTLILNSWNRHLYDSMRLVSFFSKVKSVEVHFDISWLDKVVFRELILLFCKTIESLMIFRASNMSTIGWKYICSKCVNLKSFLVGKGMDFTDKCLIKLSENCPNLQSLEILSGCHRISSFGLIQFSKNCKNLQKLTVGQHTEICGHGIMGLLNNCTDLEALNIDLLEHNLCEELALKISTSCRFLTKLYISEIDNAIYAVLFNCELLQHLTLKDMTEIDVVRDNNHVCQHLTRLTVKNVSVFNYDDYFDNERKFGELMPNLTYLSVLDCNPFTLLDCGFNKSLSNLTELIVSYENNVAELICHNIALKVVNIFVPLQDAVLLFTSLATSKCAASMITFHCSCLLETNEDINMDEIISLLAKNCCNLTALTLSYFCMTNDSFKAIQTHCKQLKYLDISNSYGFSGADMANCVAGCKKLVKFSNRLMRPGSADFNSDVESDSDNA